MNPKHNELSLEELDAVAAGNIFGNAWRLIKGEPTVKVDYVAAVRTLYNVGRSLIRLFW
jgi:hypothetical protein